VRNLRSSASPRLVRAHAVHPIRRARLTIARHPTLYWALVATVAALSAGLVVERANDAEAARRRWGHDRPVAVATVDLPPGRTITAADVRIERWPVAVGPADALRLVAPGTIVSSAIGAGEPFVPHRLGRPAGGPVAAVLATGRRAVTVPTGDAPSPVEPGDRVDLVAAGLALDAVVVARDAEVVQTREQAVVVAVETAELPAVAGALVNGTVVVAVSGDPPRPP
jgi:Flp pilus assembly protein CpaB